MDNWIILVYVNEIKKTSIASITEAQTMPIKHFSLYQYKTVFLRIYNPYVGH